MPSEFGLAWGRFVMQVSKSCALKPEDLDTKLTDYIENEILAMTDLLDRAIARTRDLPPEMQDEVARMVLLFAGEDDGIIPLTPEEEEAGLAEAEAEIERGELASEEEVRAIFAKHVA